MSIEQLSEHYYTAAGARKVLGLSEDSFQYWVKTNRITKIVLPGRKQGVYAKREVDRLAKRIETSMLAYVPEEYEYEYRKATLDDVPAEYNLSRLIFGKWAHTIETRRRFIEHNPDVSYHLYHNDELVAFLTIIPFNHETIQHFIRGEERGWTIDPKNIEQFTPDHPLECVLMEMATTPTVPPAKRTYYGSVLLEWFATTMEEWGKNGVHLTKFFATSSTPSGIGIMKNAGFKAIEDLGDGRFGFELDLESSSIKLLEGYKAALAQYQEEKSTANLTAKRSDHSQRGPTRTDRIRSSQPLLEQ